MADPPNIATIAAGKKRDFANAARSFVKWTARLRLVPELPMVALAIAVIASLGGAFGTLTMPPGERMLFWLLVMGWNAAKWVAWFNWRVRSPRDWWPAALIGTVLLNLSLPFELAAALWLTGSGLPPPPHAVWLNSLVLAGIALLFLLWRFPPWSKQPAPVPPGILTRNGSSPARVLAVNAEDHYCRLFEEDGRQRLVLARFGDVLEELGEQEGAQIHRGAWVADRAIVGARRSGRSWEVVLPCGEALRVSAPYRAAARERGWLAR